MNRWLATLIGLTLLVLAGHSAAVLAKNTFADFSLAPTFTPPPGCVPTDTNYGAISRCEQTIAPGNRFFVVADTALGWGTTTEIFVDDHVKEIKSYWENDYSGKNLWFSSRPSKFLPAGDLPKKGTECREYSIRELDDPTGNPPVQTLWRINGLTCAWYVENPKTKATIELFWLEIHDGFDPSKGQKPLASLDAVVRNVFASARMIKPAPYLDGVKAGLDPASIDCLIESREWRVRKGWRAMAVSDVVTIG